MRWLQVNGHACTHNTRKHECKHEYAHYAHYAQTNMWIKNTTALARNQNSHLLGEQAKNRDLIEQIQIVVDRTLFARTTFACVCVCVLFRCYDDRSDQPTPRAEQSGLRFGWVGWLRGFCCERRILHCNARKTFIIYSIHMVMYTHALLQQSHQFTYVAVCLCAYVMLKRSPDERSRRRRRRQRI